MITKKDLITDAQLQRDIRELKKDPAYNKGASKTMEFIESTNRAGKRLRRQWKFHGKKRRAAKRLSPKAIAGGSTNGIRRSNAKLKNQLNSLKSK